MIIIQVFLQENPILCATQHPNTTKRHSSCMKCRRSFEINYTDSLFTKKKYRERFSKSMFFHDNEGNF